MKQWFKYIKPYLPFFILGPLCMIVEVIGEVLMPKFIAIVINGAENNTLTISNSITTALLMILTALFMMVGGVGGAYFGAKASVNFAADLRSDIFKKVQSFSFANIDKFSTGSLVTRLTNDVTQLQNFINMLLRMCLRAPGMLIGAIIMAVVMRPDLSLVLLITIPLMLISLLFLISKGFPRFAKVQENIDGLNNTVQENITNVRVVKSFVRENYETKKFKAANANLKQSGLSAMKIMIFMGPVMTIFMNITTLAVLWFGSNIVLGESGTVGGMQVGDLSAFITYVTQILSSLMMVTFMLMTSSRALASAKRIKEVLNEESDISDTFATFPEKQVMDGSIEFRNVTFKYFKNREETVLSGINLKINAGQTVGIIGSTGSGKTTLVSLIPRLYDPDSGEVLIDGVNVKDYSLYNLREGVGMVLQKNVLFSGTISENLLWGDSNATLEEMKLAAKYSEAHGFIESFKNGYDTELEQGG
ncbi:MAG: ABC transporter ATP-binding protein, partial [Clostridia bacterium]|nr:ABC transporter ATP-binding protein [Clostridia bacterium]